MKILLNNGHPIASLDQLALELEGAAGALENLAMIVRPIEPNICEGCIAPDEDQIDEHFRCIGSVIRRIATDLSIYFESERNTEAAQAERIRHLPVTDPQDPNYLSDEEIAGMVKERWGPGWNLRSVDPDDPWVREYCRRIALRSMESKKK